MNSETQKKIKTNRLLARRRFLNKLDIIDFTNVPGFIIDAFFDEPTYHGRLLVTTFGHVNGLNEHQIFKLIKWTPIKEKHKKKISDLLKWLKDAENGAHFYSYNVVKKQVLFCNGDLRYYGKRIEKNK